MTAPDDDSLPVMVLRNDKPTVPISAERVTRLRKHLVVTLRALRKLKKSRSFRFASTGGT
jgi:hypothetical protein